MGGLADSVDPAGDRLGHLVKGLGKKRQDGASASPRQAAR
jgi:hypothetical protein